MINNIIVYTKQKLSKQKTSFELTNCIQFQHLKPGRYGLFILNIKIIQFQVCILNDKNIGVNNTRNVKRK